MEHIAVWVAIFTGIVLPFVGWIFNTLITKKIDTVIDRQEKDSGLFFKRLDEERLNVSNNYVRRDIYEQATKFYFDHSEEKFKSVLHIMNTKFESMEDKIDEVKTLISEMKNGDK